jgi:hypothetical protein
LGHVRIEIKIILKRIAQKRNLKNWTGPNWLRKGELGKCCAFIREIQRTSINRTKERETGNRL